MQYPLISEYVRAIQDASDNLDKLAHLTPVLDDHGDPYHSSGAFAVVFKMKDEQTGKYYALKCFTEEQEGRAEAYQQIADELNSIDSPYITSVKYLEKEIFVDCSCEEDEFPVLLMDWIEGENMSTYIATNYLDEYAMNMLCYYFCKMAAWLHSQPFALGDIKPDNIIVRPNGTLVLVDYDGMFVPSMKGQKSPTNGTKGFSHPLRTIEDFDENIDDFALTSIALSLKIISLIPSLLDGYGAPDRLLFSSDDYRDLSKCKILSAILDELHDKEVAQLLSLFLLSYTQRTLSKCSFRSFRITKPKIEESLSTQVTKEDLAEAVIDEYGVKYSKDGKRLFGVPLGFKGYYIIKRGTQVICDKACYRCFSLTNIVIPNSVTHIGNEAFMECRFSSITIPNWVKSIGKRAFYNCEKLKSIVIPKRVTNIEDHTFYGCKSLTSIVIPKRITNIGDCAFYGCHSLTNIMIPNRITNIRERAFSYCESLTNIVIPDSVTSIGEGAFRSCSSLSNLVISSSITRISKRAFSHCSSLTSIVIPDSVTNIGEEAFFACTSLTSFVIPDSVTNIGKKAFGGCNRLSTEMKEELTSRFGYTDFFIWFRKY